MPRRLVIALACGSIILTLSVGLRQVFGLFLIPVTQDLSVARETYGLIVGLQNLVWGLAQPISGYIADRFGAARVAFFGGIIYATGLVLAAISMRAGKDGSAPATRTPEFRLSPIENPSNDLVLANGFPTAPNEINDLIRTVDQEVGGSSPPSCTSRINSLQ